MGIYWLYCDFWSGVDDDGNNRDCTDQKYGRSHFALIIGTAVGLLLHVSAWINRGAFQMQRIIARFVPAHKTLSEEEFSASLLTGIVLFVSSDTGIYGALVNGMTGDATILITKSILDFFHGRYFCSQLGICCVDDSVFVG